MLATIMEDMAKPEILWFLAGLLMILVEFAMPGLVIMFFGLGALVTSVVCMIFEISFNIQLIIFMVASIAMLLVLRNSLKKIFIGQSVKEGGELPASTSEFVGSEVTVVERIEKHAGKVELNGTQWSARSSREIEVGEVVKVTGQQNLTLYVEPI